MIAEQIKQGEISEINQEKLWRYMRDLKEKYEAIQNRYTYMTGLWMGSFTA